MINDVRERSRGASSFLPWHGLRMRPGHGRDPARPVDGKEREGRSVCWGTSPPWALDPGEVSLRAHLVGATTVLQKASTDTSQLGLMSF